VKWDDVINPAKVLQVDDRKHEAKVSFMEEARQRGDKNCLNGLREKIYRMYIAGSLCVKFKSQLLAAKASAASFNYRKSTICFLTLNKLSFNKFHLFDLML
jgi:hypothetical protein